MNTYDNDPMYTIQPKIDQVQKEKQGLKLSE